MRTPSVKPTDSNGTKRDPSSNVYALVDAGMQRQDDLREMEATYLQRMGVMLIVGAAGFGIVSAVYGNMLRNKEAERIDAIRKVDVAAVKQASDTSNQAALALQNTVTTSAETLRKQVETTAQAQSNALDSRLTPIQKDIADLRRDQYAQQGAKSATTEGKEDNKWGLTIAVSVTAIFVSIILSIGGAVVAYLITHPVH